MRRRGAAVLFLAVASAVSPAFANYTLIGAGTASCGTWTQNRKHPTLDTKQLEQWVFGFLSGAGFVGEKYDPLNGLDAQAVLGWLDNYCQANPLKKIAIAAEGFIVAHPK